MSGFSLVFAEQTMNLSLFDFLLVLKNQKLNSYVKGTRQEKRRQKEASEDTQRKESRKESEKGRQDGRWHVSIRRALGLMSIH